MNPQPRTPSPGDVGGAVQVVPQTGMPPIYQKRSKEVIYDALQDELRFIKNRFGPQWLILTRPNLHW